MQPFFSLKGGQYTFLWRSSPLGAAQVRATFFLFLFPLISIFFWSCETKETNNMIDQKSYNLGVIGGFSELINAGVKQLALSAALAPTEMNQLMEEAQKIAARHQVEIFRESDLLVTDLFPADVAKGKDVLLLYQGTTKSAYLALKEEKKKLEEAGKYKGQARLDIARRFGRMLSYTPRKINRLLAENTSFRVMSDFGIRASNVFLYYKDLDRAARFYENILGMELLADYTMAKIFRMTSDSYLILVDASKGMHTADEPKTVALALLTDQLAEWYAYFQSKKVPIKYTYKPKQGSPHDGFVAVDPEGYLLEFELFKQHPENEHFIPILEQNETIFPSGEPKGLGIKSTITWLYYKDILAMQNFFQDILGLEMVADQGWTKIYQVSKTGFIGLVDEKRGMHSFTEQKGVTVSFFIDQIDEWFAYVQEHRPFELRSEKLEIGPEGKYRAFVGFDPEGYFLEFDIFQEHADNVKLLQYLNQ